MYFTLMGIDFDTKNRLFGVVLAHIANANSESRSLLAVYYSNGDWRVDIGFMQVV